MRENVINGIATTLWASAWAKHANERQCQSLSPNETPESVALDRMPPMSQTALRHAENVAKAIELANGRPLVECLRWAYRADRRWGIPSNFDSDYAVRFGHDLALMSLGSRVAFCDDAENFTLQVPLVEVSDTSSLRSYADAHCAECGIQRRR